jgi:ankyrin repeat protein
VTDVLSEGLKLASRNKHRRAAALLLESGADPHSGNDEALELAAVNGDYKMVELLLQHGANVHVGNEAVLLVASSMGHFEVVKALLRNGAVPRHEMVNEARSRGYFLVSYLLERAMNSSLRSYYVLAGLVLLSILLTFSGPALLVHKYY